MLKELQSRKRERSIHNAESKLEKLAEWGLWWIIAECWMKALDGAAKVEKEQPLIIYVTQESKIEKKVLFKSY